MSVTYFPKDDESISVQKEIITKKTGREFPLSEPFHDKLVADGKLVKFVDGQQVDVDGTKIKFRDEVVSGTTSADVAPVAREESADAGKASDPKAVDDQLFTEAELKAFSEDQLKAIAHAFGIPFVDAAQVVVEIAKSNPDKKRVAEILKEAEETAKLVKATAPKEADKAKEDKAADAAKK